MATLVVAVVAIHLVAGPILFRRALERAGEVGQAGQPTQTERVDLAACRPTSSGSLLS